MARGSAAWLIVLALAGTPPSLAAQRLITLPEAIDSALKVDPRVAIARADLAAARGAVITAREFPNPSLSVGYSESVPQWHLDLNQPLEYPWVRRSRIRAAVNSVSGALDLVGAQRLAVRYDVEVAYINAAALAEMVRLSRRTAEGAERLLAVARARRAAGDASDLDVALASITAGQLGKAALADSAAAVDALIALQVLIGGSASNVQIALADSLSDIRLPSSPRKTPLRIAAAQYTLESGKWQVRFQRGLRFPVPTVRAGFEFGDPTGTELGILPTVGFSIPLPIWNKNRGAIAGARAAVNRAAAEIASVLDATYATIAIAERERAVAAERVLRNRAIIADANRVTDLSITGYEEGALPLMNVLEAQRVARDAQRQHILDLAALRTAEALLNLASTAGVLTPLVVPLVPVR